MINQKIFYSCKKMILVALALVMLVGIMPVGLLQNPVITAQAASSTLKCYKVMDDGTSRVKIGNYYAWRVYKNGKSCLYVAKSKTASGTSIGTMEMFACNVFSDGKYLYYVNYTGQYSASTVYKVKLDKMSKTKLVSKIGLTDIESYYNNKLYLSLCNDNGYYLYTYNLKSKKYNKLGYYRNPETSGKYMCMTSGKGAQDYTCTSLYLCNRSNDSVKKISSKAQVYYIKGNYIYYAETKNPKAYLADLVVKKYCISSKKTSTIKTFKGKLESVKITDKYFVYNNESSGLKTYTFSSQPIYYPGEYKKTINKTTYRISMNQYTSGNAYVDGCFYIYKGKSTKILKSGEQKKTAKNKYLYKTKKGSLTFTISKNYMTVKQTGTVIKGINLSGKYSLVRRYPRP